MSNLSSLLGKTSELAEEILQPGFEIRILPSDKDGDRFQIGYQGDNWGASAIATLRWRGLTLSFAPHGYGGFLVRHAEETLKAIDMPAFIDGIGIQRLKGLLDIWVDGHPVALSDRGDWPNGWRTLEVRATFSPFDSRASDGTPNIDELVPRIRCFFLLLARLVPPFSSEPFVEDMLEGVPDGARTQIEVNRYERDRANRAACIAAHGTTCAVCGMSFGERYGSIGEGYIHVHHRTPVSQLGGATPIDPRRDLVPVCANCHAMLHKRNPPYSIDELKTYVLE